MSVFAYEIDEACGVVKFFHCGVYSHERPFSYFENAGVRSVDEFRADYNASGWTERTSLATHHVSSAERDELDSYRTQPVHVSHCEPDRAPLPHFGQRTPFDAFRGFTVVSDCAVESQPATRSPDIGLTSHQVNPIHGSASLLKD